MPALPLGGAPVRAALVIYDPPVGTGNTPGPERARVELHFNPERLAMSKSASWKRGWAPSSAGAARAQFVAAQPRTMSVEVFLDAPARKGGVQQSVEQLLSCCVPTSQSAAAKPASAPWVRLKWGRARTTAFLALVTQVDATYTRFDTDGTPLRAECTVTLEEAGGAPARQNPSSGGNGPVDTHRVVAGDTLPGLAWRAYGDPGQWRAIARANEIDDPDGVRPGTVLVLPMLEEQDPERGAER
ncbi:LysM peptidoglycan-binding domain-containing protein [Streptomyces sp. NPDC047049]|uniref:CIS tube protein n=1 Tax=Streptomyces sp. NPDC047049 TaxID=3156688 RepID=UPI0033DE593D